MLWIVLKGIFFYIGMILLTAKIYKILDDYEIVDVWDGSMLALFAFLWPIFITVIPFIFLWRVIKKIVGWDY